jgi:hypothetical protein
LYSEHNVGVSDPVPPAAVAAQRSEADAALQGHEQSSAPVVPRLNLSFAHAAAPSDAPLQTRQNGGLPSLSLQSPVKVHRQDDFDSDSDDEAAKKPKFKFVIKSSTEIAAAAAAAKPLAAPIVLAPTPASSDAVSSRSRDRRAAADDSERPMQPAPAEAAASQKPLAHNPAIDAQIKQYSKSQGISAAHVDVADGQVDAAQYRELEAQLIELKLSWALVL